MAYYTIVVYGFNDKRDSVEAETMQLAQKDYVYFCTRYFGSDWIELRLGFNFVFLLM